MQNLAICLTLIALVAAACGDDSDEAATTTTTASSTTSTTEPSTTSTTEVSAPALDQSCQSPDGFSISYPGEWEAVGDCGQFGPAPLEEPAQGTDERPGVVSAFVDAVPFETASGSVDGERSRAITTVDGLQAARVESVATSESLWPEGSTIVTWMVDLVVGVDDGEGTLFLDAVDVRDDVDFDRAVTMMDRMARTLEVDAGDSPESDQVVARYEGGGTPATIAAAPSATQQSTCLRLLDVSEAISCVEAVDAGDGVALTGLDGPSGPFTVGITGPDVFAVELTTGDRSLTFLPAPYPGWDSRALAVPVDGGQLESVTLRSVDGTVLAEVDPDEAQRPADS